MLKKQTPVTYFRKIIGQGFNNVYTIDDTGDSFTAPCNGVVSHGAPIGVIKMAQVVGSLVHVYGLYCNF